MSTFESTEQPIYDVFVSHASEDKAAVAMPLARRLEAFGLRVWIDSLEMTVGGSIPVGIDRGLRRSRVGVVVLSRAFFENPWPRRELDALMALEDSEGRVWLPVWHGVSAEDVLAFSPLVAMKLGVSTQNGLDEVVDAIRRAVDASSGGHPLAGPANDASATRRSASEVAAEELASVRRALLQLSTTAELRRQLYVVEEFLERYPKHPEGRELKGQVEKALGFAKQPPSVARSKRRGWPAARGGLAAAFLLAVVVSLWRSQMRQVPGDVALPFPAAAPPFPEPPPPPADATPPRTTASRPPADATPPRRTASRPDPYPARQPDAYPTRTDSEPRRAPTDGAVSEFANVRIRGVEFPFPAYLDNIVRQIELRFKPRARGAFGRYPDLRSLRAEVFFIVRRDGTIGEFRFLTRSGWSEFDSEAQRAVESAGFAKAFGPLPGSYRNEFLPVNFRFDRSVIR